MKKFFSINVYHISRNEIRIIDILPANESPIIEQVAINIQSKDLDGIMDKLLKKREKLVLQMRYGLGNFDIKTQREVAEILNISRSYVSRLERKALEKLRVELDKVDK